MFKSMLGMKCYATMHDAEPLRITGKSPAWHTIRESLGGTAPKRGLMIQVPMISLKIGLYELSNIFEVKETQEKFAVFYFAGYKDPTDTISYIELK